MNSGPYDALRPDPKYLAVLDSMARILDRMETHKEPVMCHGSFCIECIQEPGPTSIYEEYCGGNKPTELDKLYLKITTPINTWYCQLPRRELNKLFEAIRIAGVEVDFSK